jgi:Zn-dependent peptidase ImmA (M78 family)/DNA-binding XRE family transcriptional regulator
MTDLGEVLTTARRASGMTQAELAELSGVSQAALSRYESGLRTPEPDHLDALARELGVTVRFLEHAGRVRGAMAIDAHMRRRATAPATAWKRLEARLNMYRMHASLMSEEVQIRAERTIPTFDPVEVDPAAAARMVRMQWQLPVGPVRQLYRWLESAGCVVIEESFGTARVDGMSQWVNGIPLMLLNSDAPTDRKRLTAAHELGHLVLHGSEIMEDPEAQANAFAAEFLMPADVIRPQLRNLAIPRLPDLKRQWGVSMAALIERSYHLDLLKPEQRTRMYKTFSAKGWRKSEPGSDSLLPEVPMLTTQINQALVGRGLTQGEVAEMSGFASPDQNRLYQPTLSRLRSVK